MTRVCRPFQPADRESLVALWDLCHLTRPWNDPHLDIDQKLARDAENLLILEEASLVIGSVMVGYDGHRGWINYLAVHPDHRRGGLGRLLMAAAEQRLRQQGCPKVNLQVRSDNPSAVHFYRRLGYAVDDVVSMGHRLQDDSSSAADRTGAG
jgi:ribosomal protein S18 acetylase RimI-like enzyme